MASSSISYEREQFQDKTDHEIATILAKKYGHIVVLRYKNNPSLDYTDFATCDYEQVNGYLKSPYCYDIEILYDSRPQGILITSKLILNAKCRWCNKATSQETLTVGLGNDFYYCCTCGAMYCAECYPELQLTNGSSGYGKCLFCDVQVERVFPGRYSQKELIIGPSVKEKAKGGFLNKLFKKELSNDDKYVHAK